MIINFGSINFDHVYRVPRMPAVGETLAVTCYERFLGGKGVNQSIAIARAGGDVRHVGCVGPDGQWVLDRIAAMGVGVDHIAQADVPTGHAVIVVDDAGDNQILICSSANVAFTGDQVDRELAAGTPSADWVLVQNEINMVHDIVQRARELGYRVAYSAAPFVAEHALPLIGQIDLLVVNEVEWAALAAAGGYAPDTLPVPGLLVTKGAAGAEFSSGGEISYQNAFPVTPVDTTGAGDTFLGAFIARYVVDGDAAVALRTAAAASAIQVTRPGAAAAIPEAHEVEAFLAERGD